MTEMYDVVIVGAGPGGSATAHYLAKEGFNVLLLDKFTFPRDKTCGDALTPRALHILDDMGVLDAIHQIGHRLDKVEFIAPKGHTVVAPIPQKESKYDYLLFAPRIHLDNLILEHAVASGAKFQSPVRVTDVVQEENSMVVRGENHGKEVSFRARMVIIAVGANTKLLLRMGLLKKMPQMVLCARAYYDGISTVLDAAQCRFDGVPLPGYGWVFPVSPSSANVGVGMFRSGLAARWMPSTARAVFDTFLQTPPLQKLLAGAHRSGPIKGYPLRVDFARSPTFGKRTMLVGEAAGLVNPVTGEGIDYALESGKIAAEHLSHMFAIGNFSSTQLKTYDKVLRLHYQRLFVLCDRLRTLYLNPLVLNPAIRAVARNDELMKLYMNIAIDNQDVYQGLAPKTIAKVVLGGVLRSV
ncbi:MAG: geranylgeranyl reductase family protein [Chloroflexota bacterium]|nr:geranylgeranyl reductase family protein [Chloroflexota bacterium]